MFTGIVTDIGEVIDVTAAGRTACAGFVIACGYDRASIAIGASIACAGVCLTVVETGRRTAAPGSRSMPRPRRSRITTCGSWRQGTRINLERSLKIGDELGGHIVSRPCRRHRRDRRARGSDRSWRASCSRAPRAAGALHRHEGLGRARRRVADRERGRGRRLFGADHSAHAAGDDARRLASRRRRQSRSRPDGALCRAAVGHDRGKSRPVLRHDLLDKWPRLSALAERARVIRDAPRSADMAGPRQASAKAGTRAEGRAHPRSSRRASTTTSPMRCWPARSRALERPARATIVITVPGALEIPTAIAIALDAAAAATQAL